MCKPKLFSNSSNNGVSNNGVSGSDNGGVNYFFNNFYSSGVSSVFSLLSLVAAGNHRHTGDDSERKK